MGSSDPTVGTFFSSAAIETPRIENGEYEHHGRTRRQGTQDEPPQRRMRLYIDTVDRCAVIAPDSQLVERTAVTASEQAADFLNSQLTIECSGTEDSVGSHRVRDSTNVNEENILRIENLPTGEGNGGEGTPVSPSTQADEPDTPTEAAGDDSTDTIAEEPAEEENSIKDVI
eukprot:scaffold72306_cov61-Attheya_sp.AAC.1